MGNLQRTAVESIGRGNLDDHHGSEQITQAFRNASLMKLMRCVVPEGDIVDGLVEILVEKVEECEEEMKRMREEHVEALANQTVEHESVMTTLTSELEHLKREHLISMTSFTKAKEHEEQAWKERIEEMEEERNKMEEAWKERLEGLELELERLKDDKAQHVRMWRERVEAAESELRRVEQDKSDFAERNEPIIRERCPEEENSLPPIMKGEVGSS